MIVRLLVVLIFLYLAWCLVKGLVTIVGRAPRHSSSARLTSSEDLVEDPQCHTYVPESEAIRASFNGRTVYFCSKQCYRQYKSASKQRSEEGKA